MHVCINYLEIKSNGTHNNHEVLIILCVSIKSLPQVGPVQYTHTSVLAQEVRTKSFPVVKIDLLKSCAIILPMVCQIPFRL